MSFYSILSLAPLVILALSIVSFVVGQSTAQQAIISQVEGLMGAEGAKAVQSVIQHSQNAKTGGLASAFGIVTLLFGASGVFGELQSALHKIWEVELRPGSGLVNLVKSRLLSFGMVLGIGFLLLVSLVASAGLAALGKFFGGLLPLPAAFLNTLNFLSLYSASRSCSR